MATVDTNTGTYLSNLFNPQVVGNKINKKLWDYTRFTPLAMIDNTLVGRPGNTISLPYFAKSVTAGVLAEGHDVTISQLSGDHVDVTIQKVACGVQLTDEAVLSGYGRPLDEAVDQMARAMADAVDNDVLAKMAALVSTDSDAHVTDAAALTADGIASALTLFGEDIDGDKVILVSPADYETIRKANGWIPGTEIAASAIIRGTVGMIYGCQVVVSNKLANANAAYIVKPGALAIYNKRSVLVEKDRDIVNFSTVLTASSHFCSYVYNKDKIIKMPTA